MKLGRQEWAMRERETIVAAHRQMREMVNLTLAALPNSVQYAIHLPEKLYTFPEAFPDTYQNLWLESGQEERHSHNTLMRNGIISWYEKPRAESTCCRPQLMKPVYHCVNCTINVMNWPCPFCGKRDEALYHCVRCRINCSVYPCRKCGSRSMGQPHRRPANAREDVDLVDTLMTRLNTSLEQPVTGVKRYSTIELGIEVPTKKLRLDKEKTKHVPSSKDMAFQENKHL
jgi:predicted RNA-binding Zn-ribbon protein involved in translation (DUF1610 family)